MKRALALAFAFGAGVAICGVAGIASLAWWASRPKPWNPTAITAQFDAIGTQGPENKLIFYYVLQNNTERDFRINSDGEVQLAGRLDRQQSLAGESSKDVLSGEFPFFLPARQRARLGVRLGYRYRGAVPVPTSNTKAEREHERAILAAYVSDELSNLAGFVLFHEPTRYQIELPKGWK